MESFEIDIPAITDRRSERRIRKSPGGKRRDSASCIFLDAWKPFSRDGDTLLVQFLFKKPQLKNQWSARAYSSTGYMDYSFIVAE